MKSLDNYLSRIGLLSSSQELKGNIDRATLALVMEGQSRSIAFENFDVVMNKTISMTQYDVEKKLVDDLRGGYCWEQNTLLQMALEEMGYAVTPLMCRVRWGKPDDSKEPNMAFTHFALKVTTGSGSSFLVDVGFAGTNSMEPIGIDIGQVPQELPEGRFRVAPSKHKDFYVLELFAKSEWRPLYEWRDEKAPLVDQECSNWFSCTYPKARFTTQLFTCRIIGNERHHILNDEYVIRKGHGMEKQITMERITDKSRLLYLINTVFGVKLVTTDGIDRFLPP
jgi:N-hydroxyarylamine O-acetyltransferase